MEPHPIPRQITTFEFKLIGFMTIKQFLYVALFGGLGLLTYFAIQVPYVNVISGIGIACIGLAFAFIRYNERPLDVWIRNIFLRLTTPSQYFYKKNNPLPDFLTITPSLDPQIINTHIDAKKKINEYLGISDKMQVKPENKETIPVEIEKKIEPTIAPTEQPSEQIYQPPQDSDQTNKPFIQGTISNKRGIKLPNIMVYIKDQTDKPIRMLKTNTAGFYSTFKPLPVGEYIIEAKDLNDTYFFDKITTTVLTDTPFLEINIESKESL